MNGRTLGHYRVLDKLGEGGMGEVYRAHDSKLGRDVAIKVLPEELAQDEERLRRFQREAKVLASLNHPNIAAIYGLEQSGETHYLVLELVPGETLAERIARGSIPLDEALAMARKIAEALEEAHERGIVHRDLKPANIKLTPDDKVKVLDFGLAKAFTDDTPDADNSMSPTRLRHGFGEASAAEGTRAGVILGTAAYMSPEQAKGRNVDKRTDIFALGAVLYEMLTARKAFPGDDVSEVLAAVIHLEPEWNRLPSGVSFWLGRLLRRCLEKNPRQRVRDIGDVRLELEARGDMSRDEPRKASSPLWLVAVGVLCGAIAWIAARATAPPETKSVKRFSIVLPPEQQVAKPEIQRTRSLAVSPSGSHIVFASEDRLYLRAMDRTEAAPLTGTNALQPASPFFSPDGQWIGFYSRRDRELKKIAIGDGVAVSIARTGPVMGATWNADGSILFGQGPEGIMRVSAAGGATEVVVPVNSVQGEQAGSPQLLPGGRAVIFTLANGAGGGAWMRARIVVQDLESEERRVLVERAADALYVPTGHLVFHREQGLAAVSFDFDRHVVTGESLPVVERVSRPNFAVSDEGSLVFLRSSAMTRERRLVWVDREGDEEFLPVATDWYSAVRLSPDGSRVALVVTQDELLASEIHILMLDRHALRRLTVDPGYEGIPRWTPDGARVAFASNRHGPFDLFWKASDGTGLAERLTDSPNDNPPWTFTSDGQRLILGDFHPNSGLDLHLITLNGSRETEVLLATEADEWKAELSPDNRWLAYQSDVSGVVEIYVSPFPTVEDGRWQVSDGGGTHPIWAPDGREVFYKAPGGRLMAVPIRTEPSVVIGRPSKIFDGLIVQEDEAGDMHSYDVAPDGRRFLVIREARDALDDPLAQLDELQVVLNWFEELERLAPTDD